MTRNEDFMAAKMNEECGVFGIYNHENAAELMYYGLHALQHRGQEAAGIVSGDQESMQIHKGEGLVRAVFTKKDMENLKGNHAIGHVRYSTAGGGGILNVQPFLFRFQTGAMALCHNGNLVNVDQLKQALETKGSIFQTTSDTEVLAHLIKTRQTTDFMAALKESLLHIEGAFAFLILKENELYVVLDKHGLRPLSLGRVGEAGIVIASETCAFEVIGATWERDIQTGEILKISEHGVESTTYASTKSRHLCSMEYVYLARPDSDMQGINVHQARKRCGKVLAEIAPAKADVVIGVPDSGLSAAIGYAEALKIPFEIGMVKNRYIARTFIQPSQTLREQGVKMKLSVVKSMIKGKSVVLIDDSIVRGTTTKKIINMLKDAGAKEVHVRIASPKIRYPCFYGVDFSTYEELVGATHTTEVICQMIGAESLAYLTPEGLARGITDKEIEVDDCGSCMACFTGKYPTPLY